MIHILDAGSFQYHIRFPKAKSACRYSANSSPGFFFWGGRGVWDEVGYSDLGLSLKWESFVSHLVASSPKNANIFSPPSVGCLA